MGTGLISNTTLGPLQQPGKVNRAWVDTINYDVNLSTWTYDVYVPSGYDGTKPYGVIVYVSSYSAGEVLRATADAKNLIWISPRNVGNSQPDFPSRFGASLLAIYRAKELFNIDGRRVYVSGLSGGARVAGSLGYLHSELIKGQAPSSGYGVPRVDQSSTSYVAHTGSDTDTYAGYSDALLNLYDSEMNTCVAAAIANKHRAYLITRYGDHREAYFNEGYHCAFIPLGLTTFLYDGPGGHQDASDAEMMPAIDYLDRNDTLAVNALSSNAFTGLANLSQAGATSAKVGSVKRLTSSSTAIAALKTSAGFYWDNAGGSTLAWLWEVKASAPQNQKTTFGVWLGGETWNGAAPDALTSANGPGILLTFTQTATGNRLVISACNPATSLATVFYDGPFTFRGAYSTNLTATHTGYLAGLPVEVRMELKQSGFQINFNGLTLGTPTTLASGTQIVSPNQLGLFGNWTTGLWTHDAVAPSNNTWTPFKPAIFTATSGPLSSGGATPATLDLSYMLVTDPGLPLPAPAAPAALSGTPSTGQITLTWTAPAGATSYALKRSTTPGGPYAPIAAPTGTTYTDTGLTNGIAYYYVVAANNTAGQSANSAEAAIALQPVTFSIESWRLFYFGTANATGNAADTADSDGDGIPNLMEYALGGSPTTPTLAPQVTVNAGNRLQIAFSCDGRLTQITYTVQASTDLITWTDIARSAGGGPLVAINASGSQIVDNGAPVARPVTVAASPTLAAAPRQFLRLAITRN